MARKRKTLPKNFEEVVQTGDIAAIKAVFNRCSVDAVNPKTGKTALFSPGLPEEAVRWLIGQGADINARNRMGLTPLHAQASSRTGSTALYLALGADIDAADDRRMTPLHCAAGSFRPENVSILLAHGARRDRREILFHSTPLEYMLSGCRVSRIPDAVKIAGYFLESGAPVSDKMQEHVKRIVENWISSRSGPDRETARKTETDLKQLCELFEVPLQLTPDVYDGFSPITVQSVHWKMQHNELWQLLVPRMGNADTMQGEAIRITGKIAREILDNHGAGFNHEHRNMLKSLIAFFRAGTPLPPDELKEAVILATVLNRRSETWQAEQLCKLAVQWVLLNPMPIARDAKTDAQKSIWRVLQWKKNY